MAPKPLLCFPPGVAPALPLPPTTQGPLPASPDAVKGKAMEENEHPKGALTFMLIYLLTLALLWFNAYMRLWG